MTFANHCKIQRGIVLETFIYDTIAIFMNCCRQPLNLYMIVAVLSIPSSSNGCMVCSQRFRLISVDALEKIYLQGTYFPCQKQSNRGYCGLHPCSAIDLLRPASVVGTACLCSSRLKPVPTEPSAHASPVLTGGLKGGKMNESDGHDVITAITLLKKSEENM
ncbi:hypothetical protein CDAR_420811 [Caerostris darwini]|uniref:Uncharacterized protein n=1 Tax=Caerostris darwini TaxID=1538125 RepID=A0AAV4X0I3_9ARAC|nr:hypothetical protein CDAR_420811 [Caerostris darwini]